ncbi:MAG TPA: hypothetical protein VFJ16_32405 [Longimicrobium sp.]|nr:hypothetical protein [Longimicrobium sp.]
MIHPLWKGVALLASTVAVSLAGGALLLRLSGRDQVQPELKKRVAAGSLPDADATPLHRRWGGYDAAAFVRYWKALDFQVTPASARTGRDVERRFLEMDLVFPFVYGGALAAALLLAWAANGRPFHPVWVMLPVIALVAADWTENLALLGQIRRFAAGGEPALQGGWIHVASAATMLKNLLIVVAFGTLVWLALVRSSPVPPPALTPAVG